MSSLGGDNQVIAKIQTGSKDRDDKLKFAKERQKEERQKKIEELRLHAEAAQKYREQKEEERRRRMEEIKIKDLEKRQQVEERKKAIMEADKERREYILRKNQERACRIEIKKREQNSLGFAFGSSTPRLLEPATFGMVSPSSFWCNRRSTSISNVAGCSLSRRSSERELAEIGSKKRSTSANGSDERQAKSTSMYEIFNWENSNNVALLGVQNKKNIRSLPNKSQLNFMNTGFERSIQFPWKEDKISQVMFRSVARRKTDLMPTMPIRRDGFYSSRSSLSNTPKTQGRAYSMTRLDQLALPIRRNGEHIRAIMERERGNKNNYVKFQESKNRSTSRLGKFDNSDTFAFGISRSMTHLGEGYNLRLRNTGSRSGNVTPKKVATTSRPTSAMSSSTISTSGNFIRRPTQESRKPRPVSIAGTAVSFDEINSSKKIGKSTTNTVSSPLSNTSTPKRIGNVMSSSFTATHTYSSEEKKNSSHRDVIMPIALTPKPLSARTFSADRLNGVDKKSLKGTPPLTQTTNSKLNVSCINEHSKSDSSKKITENKNEETTEALGSESNDCSPQNLEKSIPQTDIGKEYIESVDTFINNQPEISDIMNSSIIGKNKITTEEEAKAALAERRRLAREEAERQAALERQRIEAEKLLELKRQQEEAEQQRLFEEEATRLAEEQRKAEEQRLRQAIEEAKKREDDEKRKREEDDRQRSEREENEKKVKEEADRQRLEIVERLKKEEKEREERRKRVEAIMSRTRKGTASSTNSIKEHHSNNKRDDGECPQPQEPVGENSILSVSLTADESTPNIYTSSNISTAVTYNSDSDNSFCTKLSNILINENLQHDQQPQMMDVLKSKFSAELESNNYKLPNSITLATVTNGNSHIENLNKNDLILADFNKSDTNELLQLNKNTNERNSSNFNNNNLISKSLVTETRVNNDLSIL